MDINRIDDNYKRLLYAIAILYASDLHINTFLQSDYDKLTEAQKVFAKKIFDENPSFEKQILKDERLSEFDIVKDVAKVQANDGDIVEIITAGDDRVCDKCRAWQNKYVSISGNNKDYPSLQDAIDDGFLHYGCKCSLHKISEKEIADKNAEDYLQRKNKRLQEYSNFVNNHICFSGFNSKIVLNDK